MLVLHSVPQWTFEACSAPGYVNGSRFPDSFSISTRKKGTNHELNPISYWPNLYIPFDTFTNLKSPSEEKEKKMGSHGEFLGQVLTLLLQGISLKVDLTVLLVDFAGLLLQLCILLLK